MSGVDVVARNLARSAAGRAAVAAAASPVYNRAALAAWHAALANRSTAPAKALFLGDSITEGAFAASYGQRWVDVALARLRLDHPTAGVAGGFNFLPPFNPSGSPTQSYIALTGSPATSGFYGLCRTARVLNSAADSITFTFTGTSADLHWVRYSGAGTMTLQVDGGGVTNLSANGAGPTILAWNTGALAAGTHTLKIGSTGGQIYVAGLVAYNGDEAAGIQGYGGGRGGEEASALVGGTGNWTPAVALVAPQLVCLAYGTNDYSNQTSVASYIASLQSAIVTIRGQVPAASFALIAYARPGNAAPRAIGWEQYVRGLYDVADADTGGLNGASGVAVIDLSARLPNAATTGTVDPLGVYHTDRVHYAPRGHMLIGEAVGRKLGI